ncbi:DUF86 domain-containing protein [Propionivibrio sp.]|uniref:HepT-like ribonuclease domain-containing protein n=1 Tax=Propionivibrio sp. TaxID=2212460 RepID=UPI003BF0AB9A
MSKRTLQDWVDDVHLSMRNIESDMLNMSETEFLNDGKSIRAVAKSITDIGEAAHQLMNEHPEVEAKHSVVWSHLVKVYAMRNKVTHGYFGLDAGIVWSTAKKSLPVFESLIDKITVLSDEDDGDGDGTGGEAAGGLSRRPCGSTPGMG